MAATAEPITTTTTSKIPLERVFKHFQDIRQDPEIVSDPERRKNYARWTGLEWINQEEGIIAVRQLEDLIYTFRRISQETVELYSDVVLREIAIEMSKHEPHTALLLSFENKEMYDLSKIRDIRYSRHPIIREIRRDCGFTDAVVVPYEVERRISENEKIDSSYLKINIKICPGPSNMSSPKCAKARLGVQDFLLRANDEYRSPEIESSKLRRVLSEMIKFGIFCAIPGQDPKEHSSYTRGDRLTDKQDIWFRKFMIDQRFVSEEDYVYGESGKFLPSEFLLKTINFLSREEIEKIIDLGGYEIDDSLFPPPDAVVMDMIRISGRNKWITMDIPGIKNDKISQASIVFDIVGLAAKKVLEQLDLSPELYIHQPIGQWTPRARWITHIAVSAREQVEMPDAWTQLSAVEYGRLLEPIAETMIEEMFPDQ